MKNIFGLLFLIFSSVSSAQEITLNGKVMSDNMPAIGVQIMNLVTEKTAVSNGFGEFQIEAKEGDLIIFPTNKYEYKRKLIEAEDIRKGSFVVVLIPKPEELEEVIVYKNINPEDLGLVPKGQKQYTVAERRLFSAQSGPVDIIVNALTGRTRFMKMNLEAEKKQRYIEKLGRVFAVRYFVEKLKIPEEYVEGFKFYAVEFKEIQSSLKNNAIVQSELHLTQLAQAYLELLNEGIEIPETTSK